MILRIPEPYAKWANAAGRHLSFTLTGGNGKPLKGIATILAVRERPDGSTEFDLAYPEPDADRFGAVAP